MQKLALLCNESVGRVDAIRDYSFRLAEAIRRQGAEADVYLRRPNSDWSIADRRESPVPLAHIFDPREYDAVVLQYNPFLFGKWGFAPWLPARLWQWHRTGRVRIALMVHEPYVPMLDWKWVLMGSWQRAQLEATRLGADVVFASIEAWANMLGSKRPRRPVWHLPVGSNLPDKRNARTATRERLSIKTEQVVVASFGTNHPSRLMEYVVSAADALSESIADLVLLNLGAGAAPLRGLNTSIQVHAPGRLPRGDLAEWLSAADVLLAPFADGVSTRRGSVIAGLQHGLPVVGTDGQHTDSVLRENSALRLVPVHRADLFAKEAIGLATVFEERLASGRAARALYESSFDWPILANRLLHALIKPHERI
jgi:glycosyltransferase involved in cell wall biosynthesis